jgi:hypothetical protein
MFQRLRVYAAGGTLVEDIPYYARTVNMLENLTSALKNRNDAAEGFKLNLGDAENIFGPSSDTPATIGANEARKVLMPVHSGLLNQAKFLPLGYMGALVIELDLVADPLEAFARTDLAHTVEWQIEDCYMLADTITLDNELQNQYSQAILSGKQLPLHFSSYHTIMQGNPSLSDSMTMLAARGFTKLKSLFLTFWAPAIPGAGANSVAKYQRAISFQHPNDSYTLVPSRDNLQYFFQIGSKRYPESQVTSLAESFYRLRQAVGRHWGDSSISIHPGQYQARHFIIGQDLELMATSPGADDVAFTGATTTNGQIIQAEIKGLAPTGGKTPAEAYLTFHHDVILNLTSSGVDVLV